MLWSVETFESVDNEIEALPVKLRARLIRLFEMVETLGPDALREPHAKHIEGKLWELRAKAPDGIARGIYVAMDGRRVLILHVFVKKTQKTPIRALELARKRLAQVQS